MSGKSRHGRGKHSSHGKKKKMKLRQPMLASPPSPAAVPAEAPVSPPEAPIVETKRSISPPPIMAKYPYIFSELRRIGILGGVMLVILIALALILT
ncbi:MAG: hypothetical protein JSW30_03285 [Dehalococcoidia bacterium]|nr:MAG: hypothetical protein JSW30_03285 [Dehalococcoidia bacterium]